MEKNVTKFPFLEIFPHSKIYTVRMLKISSFGNFPTVRIKEEMVLDKKHIEGSHVMRKT